MHALAKEAKIQRTNAYDALEALVARGILSITTQGKKRLFRAESPSVLRNLFEEKLNSLNNIIPQLELLRATTEYKPRVLFYPGVEGYRRVYEDSLTTNEKKILGIFAVKDIWDVLGREYVDRIIEKRAKQGITLRVVRSRERDSSDTIYPSSTRELRDMRHAPAGMIFPITMYVYDHKVTYLSSEKETFGLLIESPDIAQAHRNYFEALWQISTPN